MDAILVTIAMKGFIALALVIGGISAITFGYRLYLKGIGLNNDEISLEVFHMKAKTQKVGAVLMLTSSMWGYFGHLTAPSLIKQGELSRVADSRDINDKSINEALNMRRILSDNPKERELGYRFFMAEDPELAKKLQDKIINNVYSTDEMGQVRLEEIRSEKIKKESL
jgi:hypothetical protein